MKKLKYLNLCDNCLPISPEILGNPEDVDVILNYYHQLDSSSVRPLNEAKLLVVGQGSVGKTSLVNQFVDNQIGRASCRERV